MEGTPIINLSARQVHRGEL